MMGVAGNHKLSDSERKNLFDPTPLKFYRPPLKSDTRGLTEKIAQLFVGQEPAPNHNRINISASLPSNVQSPSSNQPARRKYSFSVSQCDHGEKSEEDRVCVSRPTLLSKSGEDGRERQSQCWRLGLYAIKSPDSQLQGRPPLMASTPVASSDPALNCDIQPKSLITKNVALHNQMTQPLSDSLSCGHGTSDTSFDESLSTFEGVAPLSSEDLASEPDSLPENHRRRLHLCDVDQRTEDSSGIGSLNSSMQNSSSHSSPVRKERSHSLLQLPQSSVVHSMKELNQTSRGLENSLDCSLSQSSKNSVHSSTSPVSTRKGGMVLSRTESKIFPNSLSNSMSKNSDSSSDSGTPGSSPGKVVHSWKASFSTSEVKRPTSSELNFKPNSSKEFKSKWDDNSSNSSMASMGLPTSFGPRNTMKRKSVNVSATSTDLNEILRESFSKRFSFESADWRLPDPDTLFTSEPWKINQFLRQKQRLNTVKDELNDLPLQDWHKHTRRRNIAGNIIWQLRNKIDPEFPTQAWCKFYENVASFPLVPVKAIKNKCLNSIHLCEAPGAFITSLNHFLHANYGDDFKFDWRAVTLNPYYEGNPLSCMINDDRLILKTLDKWLFGEDNTGDLMQPANLKSIAEGASQLGQILLVTADGSIDCQDNPAEQEDIVSWLHYCETVAALQILAPGGSFLVKMFTFYEHFSIGLMYLLNCVFKKVIVNKPVTSKEGNSEVYVVCLDYHGAHAIKPWLDVLSKHYGPKAPPTTLFCMDDLPVCFVDQLYRCADFFRKAQTRVIEENLRSFHHPARQDNYLIARIRNRVADDFFVRYELKKLDRKFCLVDKRNINGIATPNIDPRQEEGSFNDRRKRLTLSPEEELKYLKDDLNNLAVAWPGDFDVFWMDFPENPKGFKIVRGKPISKVHSSKFCLGRLLKIRNRVREIAQQHYKVRISHKVSSESETRSFPWPEDSDSPTKRKVLSLDFKNELWASLEDGSNALNEKNACRKILNVIENDIFRDYCFELRGYPMLTQFNVGLVFLLGHLFEKVGFVQPKGQDIRVLFYNYRKFNPEMKRHWDDVVAGMERDSETVLSVIQVSQLSDGDFYKYVTEINNLCVLEQVEDLLALMSAD
ncbi:cap-specific mRNA (nucleoside-2'-O-)-methyltransferase 2 [Thrips palmi]|uniref:Cap-specific mRNA (nucleoside-2'-O-)-methyltransferase 2 n=1 Tax=Thrips palmi TaxID=161013 RepID=A0A6P8Y455_THRPL|nr:cap-specific mRNA (nucleoside-2'-O-)-methyltransferase 2 [Thrips palmi]